MAIAPDHPLARAAAARDEKLAAFCDECRRMGTSVAVLETAEKMGYDTGIRAVHPLDPDWTVPVYVANFILMDYGTGAIFGCPGGDQRDIEFATKYGLPVLPRRGTGRPGGTREGHCRCRAGDSVRWRRRDGQFTLPRRDDDTSRLRCDLDAAGGDDARDLPVARRKTNYKLRDWGISRQRYWGCPIPAIHCDACGTVPVPDDQLPVLLPDDASFDRPGNPLDHHPTWKHVACPHCGKPARRETDTMDTFGDSSWYYYARFTDPQNESRPTTPGVVDGPKGWLPVDQYIGGIEPCDSCTCSTRASSPAR